MISRSQGSSFTSRRTFQSKEIAGEASQTLDQAPQSRGRRSTQAQEDEQRHEERGEQQALAPQGPMVLPPPPPVDYGMFMQGLVQAMLRLHLQFPRSIPMVVCPSWRGLRGWLYLLLRRRVGLFWQRAG
ncbi:hypothetical protein Taro_028379 [Colocasia esculenta]|uniref:Uncharacterized protein n=1 Tax=Colocasia esculenta TaxID=4460 RepID=A0A843VB36_COLES|nr:hypothetical protein [Colocasia esculenta]